jgi:truncated hemoglobin YjbI
MQDLIDKYGGNTRLKEIIAEFHKRVVEKREVRHFLFRVTPEKLYADFVSWQPLVVRKTERYYKQPILMQTAPANFRIGAGQFEECLKIFRTMLADKPYRFERHDISRFVADVVESIEESRAQVEDTNPTVWKTIDVNTKILDHFFVSKGLITKELSNGDIDVVGGLTWPVRVHINPVEKTITVRADVQMLDGVDSTLLDVLVTEIKEKMPAVSFEIKDKLMLTRLICSYRTPLPQRLFFRAITVFTNNFSDAIELDREKLILKNTKEHKE